MGMRRRAREATLQVLYQLDVQPELSAQVALARFFAHFAQDAVATPAEGGDGDVEFTVQPVMSGEARTYLERLVNGVAENLAAIDGRITRASKNWRLERMARVDRNLIRIAVYEMDYCEDVPGKVAINEAIEIAKRFGAQETPAFVNGILDRVLSDRAPGDRG